MKVLYTHLDKGLCPISWDATWGEPTRVGYDPSREVRETFLQFGGHWCFGITTFRWRRISPREMRALEEEGLMGGGSPVWHGFVHEGEEEFPLHIPPSSVLMAYHPQAGARLPSEVGSRTP